MKKKTAFELVPGDVILDPANPRSFVTIVSVEFTKSSDELAVVQLMFMRAEPFEILKWTCYNKTFRHLCLSV